ncbi:hypothetical protein Ahu01nite_092460 [Winogradskya humida]|uniref:HTH luxR-type domain-containing protein n=2 Tax=Winogradskya humida TaxID=113566 RepID=A0ABQ4A5N4_9ACTN|nr:hypothetical protein Ahu01nite_092460 [Actinoplanes humidus]
MAAIAAAFDRCRTAGSEIVVVSGTAASGRTRLLREVVSVVSAAGTPVLTAAGSPAETSAAYGVARQLWRSAGVEAEFEAYVRGAGPGRRVQPTELICSELLTSIGDRPVLLCVDDIEHVDPLSRGILLHLQRRLAGRHVLVLLTAGDSAWTTVPSFDAELHRHLPCRRLRLGPLSQAAVAEVLGEPGTSARAAAYHLASGGNPLLLGALIADGEHLAPAGPRLVHADAMFKSAVSACVHRGDEALLAVARGLAVLDRAGPARLVKIQPGLDAGEAARGVAELTRTGLLDDTGGFRCPEARAALIEATPAAERALLHRRAAELRYAEGAEVTAIAPHVLLAAEPRPSWAAGVMAEAAAEALRNGRPGTAADYADFALSTGTSTDPQVLALVTLVRAKWHTAPSAVTGHLPGLRAALRAGSLDERGVESLLSSLLWAGRFDEVEQIARDDPGARTGGARTSLAWLAFLRPPAAGDPARGGPALATLAGASGQEPAGQAAARAEAVLQNCEHTDPLVETVLATLLTLVLIDELDLAASWCTRLAADFRRRGLVTLTAVVEMVGADVTLRRGMVPAAIRDAGAALAIMSRASWGVGAGYALGTLIVAQVEGGLLDEAAVLLRTPLQPGLLDSTLGLPYLYARGCHALASGRPYAAVEDFLRCGGMLAGRGPELSTLVPWRIGLGQAYCALDRPDDARAVLEEQVRRVADGPAYLAGVALRLLAGLAGAGRRLPTLQRAAGVLENSGHHREFALSLAHLSNEYYSLGDSRRSRKTARRVLEVARQCGCEDEIRELLLGGDGSDVADLPGENGDRYPELTEAEARVARLAANGLTNREIGQRLYLSSSTVEQHLTKIFRKFRISRRTDLIGMARDEPGPRVSALRAS